MNEKRRLLPIGHGTIRRVTALRADATARGVEAVEFMSGGLLSRLGVKHIRAHRAQEHQARVRDAVLPPLAHSLRRNFADFRYALRAAE